MMHRGENYRTSRGVLIEPSLPWTITKKARSDVLGNLGNPEKQKNKRHIEDQLRRDKEFKERRNEEFKVPRRNKEKELHTLPRPDQFKHTLNEMKAMPSDHGGLQAIEVEQTKPKVIVMTISDEEGQIERTKTSSPIRACTEKTKDADAEKDSIRKET